MKFLLISHPVCYPDMTRKPPKGHNNSACTYPLQQIITKWINKTAVNILFCHFPSILNSFVLLLILEGFFPPFLSKVAKHLRGVCVGCISHYRFLSKLLIPRKSFLWILSRWGKRKGSQGRWKTTKSSIIEKATYALPAESTILSLTSQDLKSCFLQDETKDWNEMPGDKRTAVPSPRV